MIGKLEKNPDSAPEILANSMKEQESFDKTISLEEIKSKLGEVFPLPEDGVDLGKDTVETSDHLSPKEVTLSDGTVVTLPDTLPPVLHDSETGQSLSDGTVVTFPNTFPPVLHSSETGQSLEQNKSKVDDTGNPYLDDSGKYIPNNTFKVGDIVCKTDDKGKIYSKGGELKPNDIYELGGNIYQTNEYGRIMKVLARLFPTPENLRDNEAQKNAGGQDRLEGDQGGHIVGRDIGGDGGEGNLVAMDSRINQSDYKRMENDIKKSLSEGKEVMACYLLTYSGDSKRPDTIKVIVTVDGKDTVYTFDNNINGSLRERVKEIGGENAEEVVQAVLDKNGGEISSIKEEYDENGNFVQAQVTITYVNEDGKTLRTKANIFSEGGNE